MAKEKFQQVSLLILKWKDKNLFWGSIYLVEIKPHPFVHESVKLKGWPCVMWERRRLIKSTRFYNTKVVDCDSSAILLIDSTGEWNKDLFLFFISQNGSLLYIYIYLLYKCITWNAFSVMQLTWEWLRMIRIRFHMLLFPIQPARGDWCAIHVNI